MYECFSLCMSVHYVSGARGGETPGTGVTEGFESLHGCWESNVDSLEEQPMLLGIVVWLHWLASRLGCWD